MPKSSSPCLLFFSLERWDDVWRRNQFICAGLLERNPQLRILWVNPPVDALADLRAIDRIYKDATSTSGISRLWTVDLVKPLPNIIGRAVNETVYRHTVAAALRQLQIVDPLAWINDHNMVAITRALGIPTHIYDITDDWTAAGLSARQKATVINNDNWLIKHAKHVIVCSSRLRDLKSAASSLHLIPNGVDYQRYHPDALNILQGPIDFRELIGPIVGYTGTLHEDRLDVELISRLADRLPRVNFVFVGPNCLSGKSKSTLLAHPNVRLCAERPYGQLPAYLAAFDLCIAPHRVSDFTDSLDPLKLYEYFATGKPVVSTRCAGFRDFPELVKLCADSDEMAASINELLQSGEPKDLSAARLAFAADNDWTKRIMQIESLLEIRGSRTLLAR